MDIEPTHVTLVCLFCGADLEAAEDAKFTSGDLIQCQQCGEHNDYDSLIEVANEKGISEVKSEVDKQLKIELKRFFWKKR